MLVAEILNTEISPLSLNDTVSTAITKLELLRVNKFIVVNEILKAQGMINTELLMEVQDESMLLSQLPLEPVIAVHRTQHVFETTRLMFANELYILPVVDGEQNYLGLVRKREILTALGTMFNLSSFGSVLTIEFEQLDYTLSDIVRIIEIEGAKILGVAVQQPNDANPNFRVSIKLNLEDSSVVSASLRRYGYLITSEENSESLEHDFSDRADELIRYLDL